MLREEASVKLKELNFKAARIDIFIYTRGQITMCNVKGLLVVTNPQTIFTQLFHQLTVLVL